jgi:hypothetical protein
VQPKLSTVSGIVAATVPEGDVWWDFLRLLYRKPARMRGYERLP